MPNNVELERHDGAVFWGMGSQLSRAVADIEAGGSVLAFLQAALQVASLDGVVVPLHGEDQFPEWVEPQQMVILFITVATV